MYKPRQKLSISVLSEANENDTGAQRQKSPGKARVLVTCHVPDP